MQCAWSSFTRVVNVHGRRSQSRGSVNVHGRRSQESFNVHGRCSQSRGSVSVHGRRSQRSSMFMVVVHKGRQCAWWSLTRVVNVHGGR